MRLIIFNRVWHHRWKPLKNSIPRTCRITPSVCRDVGKMFKDWGEAGKPFDLLLFQNTYFNQCEVCLSFSSVCLYVPSATMTNLLMRNSYCSHWAPGLSTSDIDVSAALHLSQHGNSGGAWKRGRIKLDVPLLLTHSPPTPLSQQPQTLISPTFSPRAS